MKKSVLSLSGAAAIGVLALGLATSSAAIADPSPAGDRTYTATGSDTIQDVWNGLSNGTGAANPNVASYDAFGSSTISFNGVTINRPAGSGDGVKALSASADTAWAATAGNGYPGPGGNVNIAGKLQFARTSSGPTKDGSALTYLPAFRDAVSVLVKTSSTGAFVVTASQLANIYNCVAGANTVTVGSSTVTVNPKLPQASSGTRKFFLSAIGVSTPGSCVTTVGAENDGSQLTANGDLIPFSAAQFIAQKNGVTSNTVSSDELLASVNNGGTILDPTTGTAPSLKPGTLYGSASTEPSTAVGTFARDTYSVVATSDYTANSTLTTTVLKSRLNTTAAKAKISSYGFLPLGYVGDPTINGAGTLVAHQGAFKH
ncbi:hypothetical protein [Psychromicrobium sp. YIM B11713]|uniref:hypothetical protein n=1 Tax=Psychromicrobium sp. YIM B11713 TaxID=3145233 RepID=UPI00374F1DF8